MALGRHVLSPAGAGRAPSPPAARRARGCRSAWSRCRRGRAASAPRAGRRRSAAGGWRRRGAARAGETGRRSSPAAAASALSSRAKSWRVRWPLSPNDGNSHLSAPPAPRRPACAGRGSGPSRAWRPRSAAPSAPCRPCRAPPAASRRAAPPRPAARPARRRAGRWRRAVSISAASRAARNCTPAAAAGVGRGRVRRRQQPVDLGRSDSTLGRRAAAPRPLEHRGRIVRARCPRHRGSGGTGGWPTAAAPPRSALKPRVVEIGEIARGCRRWRPARPPAHARRETRHSRRGRADRRRACCRRRRARPPCMSRNSATAPRPVGRGGAASARFRRPPGHLTRPGGTGRAAP